MKTLTWALVAILLAPTAAAQNEDAFEKGESIMRILTEKAQQIAVALAGLVIVVAGIIAMASGGNPERRSKAFQWIGFAALGLLLVLGVSWIVGSIEGLAA